MAFEASKKAAAIKAATYVVSGMRVGLGTGSTSEEMVKALAQRLITEKLDLVVVPTSAKILELAGSLGFQVAPEYPDFAPLDIAIDGADEVDPQGGLIKGGGGALLREKLVAASAGRFVVMVDESKHVPGLGSTRGVPIEVIPFGWSRTLRDLQRLGFSQINQRLANGKPFLSDHGNYIFDCAMGPIPDPGGLNLQVKALPGVVETGLFLGMSSLIITGSEDGTTRVREVCG